MKQKITNVQALSIVHEINREREKYFVAHTDIDERAQALMVQYSDAMEEMSQLQVNTSQLIIENIRRFRLSLSMSEEKLMGNYIDSTHLTDDEPYVELCTMDEMESPSADVTTAMMEKNFFSKTEH